MKYRKLFYKTYSANGSEWDTNFFLLDFFFLDLVF